MKPVSGKELARAVEKQGWVLDRIKGSHHMYRRDDRQEFLTIPIHGSKTLKSGTQAKLMKIAGLKDSDL